MSPPDEWENGTIGSMKVECTATNKDGKHIDEYYGEGDMTVDEKTQKLLGNY